MTKSLSMPCHVTALPPDPFPELSHHKMRLYRFQDMDTPGERASTSGTSETGRTSPSITSRSTASSDVSSTETSTAADSDTQVLLIFHLQSFAYRSPKIPHQFMHLHKPTRSMRSPYTQLLTLPCHNVSFGSRAFRISAPKKMEHFTT